MDPRTSYLSANRNQRARTKPVRPPAVRGPIGAQDSMTVAERSGAVGGAMPPASTLPGHAQAQALREAAPASWTGLGGDLQSALRSGYQSGGFEGVAKTGGDDWYDLPSWLRTQLLIGARG